MKKTHFLLLVLLLLAPQAKPCTSTIVTGKATRSGRPLLYKNRDTGNMNNTVLYRQGEQYRYIGIADASQNPRSIWAGTNETGFSIMNTASYNLNDAESRKYADHEGRIMDRALSICRNARDFEHFLDTVARPICVETNFGVIDAEGGAAYYEVSNYSWKKFDVNNEKENPCGYRVQTNFSVSGRPEDSKGVERQKTAAAVMEDIYKGRMKPQPVDHHTFLDGMSRSYRHEVLGVDYSRHPGLLGDTGYAVDQDFIPRAITASAIVVEGVRPGEDPLHTVMWSILGYPSCSVAVPLLVGESNHLPDCVQPIGKDYHSTLCDKSLELKSKYIFTDQVSNGSHYFHLDAILRGQKGKTALRKCALKADREIEKTFLPLHAQWADGSLSTAEFFRSYDLLASDFLPIFQKHFSEW